MHILAIFVIWYDKDLNIWVFSRKTGHWPYGLHRILHEKNPLEHQGRHSPSPRTQPRMPPARISAIFPVGCWCTHPTCASPPSLSSISRTSRSSWMWESKSSEIWLRLLADHRRVTVPVNIDHKVRSRIAANAQNLYWPFPKTLASELSFFAFVVGAVVGRKSSSSIATSSRSHRFAGFEFEFPFDQTVNPLWPPSCVVVFSCQQGQKNDLPPRLVLPFSQ